MQLAVTDPDLKGTRLFYHHIRDIAKRLKARRILNFGAGHGLTRPGDMRDLRDIAEVWACDIDPGVLANPSADHKLVIRPGEPIDLPSESFDLIVSDWVFEHIADPEAVSRDLLRLLRPGGVICSRTPRGWGYVAIAARVVPNRLHQTVLRWIQPDRADRDIYPTHYKLNTQSQVSRHFRGCEVTCYLDGLAPAYHFHNRLLYRALKGLHDTFPSTFATAICFFIEKPGADRQPG
jgi:SAM-dependent methyltransferase